MQITIVGEDRVYIWKIKKKSRYKKFFKINGQMYKAYTSELRRLRRVKFGEFAGTDDCIIFRDNSRIPYDTNGTTLYDQDAIIEEIDAVKFAYRSKPKWGLWGKVGGSSWLWPLIVIAIFGGVTIMAFLG